MLPPKLASIYRSLNALPTPRSDDQDTLIAELRSLDRGESIPPAVGGSRSLGTPVSVCDLCGRPFAA